MKMSKSKHISTDSTEQYYL